VTRIRKPIAIAAAGAALAAPAASLALTTGAPPSARTAAAAAATVKVASTSLGKILVSRSGFTLYMFTHDKRGKDSCVMMAGCASAWPPYTLKGKPAAGPGVKRSLLGTTKISGKEQLTYDGHPLYTYSGDTGRAATDYVGARAFGGTWYAISTAGKTVK
jgi:predicted lipoprotein with Yx(FWY)xxD motif